MLFKMTITYYIVTVCTLLIMFTILGSESSQQSWFLPSSEASALSAEEIEGVDSGFSDATPAAFSEDSQEAMNNSNNSNDETSKNSTTAEVATKNLTSDLTGMCSKIPRKVKCYCTYRVSRL